MINALKKAGINSLEEARQKEGNCLLKIKGIGKKAFYQIKGWQ